MEKTTMADLLSAKERRAESMTKARAVWHTYTVEQKNLTFNLFLVGLSAGVVFGMWIGWF